MKKRVVAFLGGFLFFFFTSVFAETGALRAGDPAPAFKVERFLKGNPFTTFAKGNVYVIELWSTWCGPCIEAIPHLSSLQRQYRDKGLVICAVNVQEDPEYSPQSLEKVRQFIERRGKGMNYTIAYDGAAKVMDTTWCQRSGLPGIPCSFVIDKSGKIAWIGHPMELDLVINQVCAGTWDNIKGPEQINAARKEFKDALVEYANGLKNGDDAWVIAAERHPAIAAVRTADRFAAMWNAGHSEAAYTLGAQIVAAGKQSGDPSLMQNMMVALRNRRRTADPAYRQLLLTAATETFALSDPTEAGPHAVLASAYFAAGENEKGQISAAKAVELSDPRVRASMEAWTEEMKQGK